MAVFSIADDELATILAALRFYQGEGMGEPALRSHAINDIACAQGDVISLDAPAIDGLCERLNTGALTSAQALSIFGADQDAREPHLKAYRDAVDTSDGLEVDDDALVSAGEDGGAFVQAWVWVTDEEAGVTRTEEDAEEDAAREIEDMDMPGGFN